MTSTVRYKFVQNSTAGALTVDNFPVINDGDDKQRKDLKRILVAADFGGQAGKIDNISGLILDVIPQSYNVLWFSVRVFRPVLVGNVFQYNELNNQVTSITLDGEEIDFEIFEIVFWLEEDNTLRVFDKGHTQATASLVEGDLITAEVILGPQQDTRDSMN